VAPRRPSRTRAVIWTPLASRDCRARGSFSRATESPGRLRWITIFAGVSAGPGNRRSARHSRDRDGETATAAVTVAPRSGRSKALAERHAAADPRLQLQPKRERAREQPVDLKAVQPDAAKTDEPCSHAVKVDPAAALSSATRPIRRGRKISQSADAKIAQPADDAT
jgi:hypothetical protein